MQVDKAFARFDFAAHQPVFVNQAIAVGDDPPGKLHLITGNRQHKGRKPGVPNEGAWNGRGGRHHAVLVGVHPGGKANLRAVGNQHTEVKDRVAHRS